MKATEIIAETQRIAPHGYTGGKSDLRYNAIPDKNYKLPGDSGLNYGMHNDGVYGVTILVSDPQTLQVVGSLSLHKVRRFFVPNTYEVHTITVDEDYRGRGIAKALYGIALTIKHMNLKSGSSQTPDGRRNWVSLAKIPGCEVVGVLQIFNSQLEQPGPFATANYAKHREKEVSKIIDSLMTIGCDYQGKYDDRHCFIFPLRIGKNELATAIKNNVQVYHDSYEAAGGTWRTSMLARWIG
jgi:GNAT superfamily N-acetyltransferase